ncbi:MAG: nucleotidyltransferase family protein [Cellulosilyticaceae bacterium]
MKIKAIILAAGESKRFGSKKLLEEFLGKPLIQHVIDEVVKVEFEEIVVVTQYEAIKKLESTHKIHMIDNENVDKGISHSIYLGINEERDYDGYMFIVGDQPFITSQIIETMVSKFEIGNGNILCMSHKGRRGSPTLFDKCYKDELLQLTGDIGGRQVMQNHPECVINYEIDDPICLEDIDTREDYIKLKRYKRNK